MKPLFSENESFDGPSSESSDEASNQKNVVKRKTNNVSDESKTVSQTKVLQMSDEEIERKIKEAVKQNVLLFPVSDEAFERFTSYESQRENSQVKQPLSSDVKQVKPIDWQKVNWLIIALFCLANTGLLIFDSADFFLAKGFNDIKAWGYAGLSEIGILLITALAAKSRDQAAKVGYLFVLGIAILLQGFVVHSSIDQKGRQTASEMMAESQESKIVLSMIEQLQSSVESIQADIDKFDPGRNKTARENLLAKKQALLDEIEQKRSQLRLTQASLGDSVNKVELETTLVQWVRWFQLLIGVVLVHWLVREGMRLYNI